MENQLVFAKNLRLLVSYSQSIASVSRDLQISRQQFTKYLAWKNEKYFFFVAFNIAYNNV